jgi:hypothetical protein
MSMAQGSSRARKSALVSKDFSAVSEGCSRRYAKKYRNTAILGTGALGE